MNQDRIEAESTKYHSQYIRLDGVAWRGRSRGEKVPKAGRSSISLNLLAERVHGQGRDDEAKCRTWSMILPASM